MANRISRRRVLQASATALAAANTTTLGNALITSAQAAEQVTVAKYILTRLKQHNVDTLFGVPGATWEGLFKQISENNVSLVVTSSDLEAGYAADGYARMVGLGAVAVTRGVGMLSMINAIGGAYAERSPVVVINGGPTGYDISGQRNLGVLYSHATGKDGGDLAIFKEVTAYAGRAETRSQVASVVDTALTTALTSKRPVYIEINRDLLDENVKIDAPTGTLSATASASGREPDLAGRIISHLQNAARPALLLGSEIQRYGLHNEAVALINKLAIPWATTVLAKSVIPDQTPGFVGTYSPTSPTPKLNDLFQQTDGLVILGATLSIGYRRYVADNASKIVRAGDGKVRFKSESPVPAGLPALIAAMQQKPWTVTPAHTAHLNAKKLAGLSFDQRRERLPNPNPTSGGLTYVQVVRSVSNFIDQSFVLIPDTSLSMYPAADIHIRGRNGYVANAVWQSIGYSIGAAIGVGLAKRTDQPIRRPLVICGDGGFQMNAQSLSTIAKQKTRDNQRIRAIVIVLDNALYAIEQKLVGSGYFSGGNANPYLLLNRWNYNELAKAMGFQFTRTATDVASLAAALDAARIAEGPAFITATMNPRDLPAGVT